MTAFQIRCSRVPLSFEEVETAFSEVVESSFAEGGAGAGAKPLTGDEWKEREDDGWFNRNKGWNFGAKWLIKNGDS